MKKFSYTIKDELGIHGRPGSLRRISMGVGIAKGGRKNMIKISGKAVYKGIVPGPVAVLKKRRTAGEAKKGYGCRRGNFPYGKSRTGGTETASATL